MRLLRIYLAPNSVVGSLGEFKERTLFPSKYLQPKLGKEDTCIRKRTIMLYVQYIGPTGSIEGVTSMGHGHAQGESGQAFQQKRGTQDQDQVPTPQRRPVSPETCPPGRLGEVWGVQSELVDQQRPLVAWGWMTDSGAPRAVLPLQLLPPPPAHHRPHHTHNRS